MTAMPTHCTDCQRPLRDSRTKPEDAPGTIIYGGNGHCTTCRKRHNPRPPKRTHCDYCGREVRHGPRQGPGDNSVYYSGNGECANCRKRRQTAERNGTILEITPAQHAYNLMIHHTFITERRKRGVPVDGYQTDDTPDTLAQLTARPKKTPSQRLALARLLEQLEHERAGVAAATRIQEARHRNEYGTAA